MRGARLTGAHDALRRLGMEKWAAPLVGGPAIPWETPVAAPPKPVNVLTQILGAVPGVAAQPHPVDTRPAVAPRPTMLGYNVPLVSVRW